MRLSALDARRTALGEVAHLLKARHRRVTRKGREEGAVCPTKIEGALRLFSCEETVNETRREAVAGAYSVQNLEIADGRGIDLVLDAGDRSPFVPARRGHGAKRRGNDLDLGVLGQNAFDHLGVDPRVHSAAVTDLRARDAERFLQVLLVADKDIDVLHDAPVGRHGLASTTPGAPQLLAVI